MRKTLVVAVVVVVAACGSDNNVASQNNGANNDANNTSNNASNNATNNETSGSNNLSNNATNNPTNNTTGPNNNTNNTTPTCEPLDPAIGDCDPICQTGCDVGDHCLVDADAMAMCGPAGPRLQDEACSADTECDLGFHCRSVGGGDRTCLSYCDPNADRTGCSSSHACVRLQADNRIGACVPIVDECEVVPTDECADPDECYGTIQGRKCLPAGTVALDEDCTRSSDCAPGLRCVTIMDTGQVCKPLCDPQGGDDQCTDGMCRALSNPQGQPLDWGACY